MNKINSINLINFKAYKNQTFDFEGLTVFCGSNSVGKSTAIQALGILLQSNCGRNVNINGELVNVGDIDDIHNFFNRSEETLKITLNTDKFTASWGYENIDQKEYLARKNMLPRINHTNNNEKISDESNEAGSNIIYQYLHAERFGPRNNLPMAEHNHNYDWLGTKGEFTIEVLESLISEKRLELENEDIRKHPSTGKSHSVYSNIEAWMEEITPGYKMNPKKIKEARLSYNTVLPPHGYETKPINVGFGYSYALSVVTALLISKRGDVVIIENPEAHLHPKGQSYLGRLIALSSMSGLQIIIETHSEHIINGIRLMIRSGSVIANNVIFYNIYNNNLESKVVKIKLNQQAQFSSWPENFFDQQAIDMDMLISGGVI
ncbi:DUF3696 domain-containing protein [Erwinia aphidicola]|uniref:DUF3696 domain-containing protein n=1 Tax=Erwinia aphidicola TaxID=68334 RepID=UPI00209ED766|nr:DUF3696 domain-containing protein [Erwinia aphidicola]MCP2230637.1 putative ATPase [Erwinia aphidicola]